MKRRRQSPSALRRATGLVLSLLLTLSYFSPSQQALRNLPDTLHLTAGQLQTLELGSMLTLTTQAGTAAVSASEDETLRAQGAVSLSSETAGTSELLLSLMGLLPLGRDWAFPIRTFAINLFGAFAIGAITALAVKRADLDPRLVLFLKAGVCGGFTTFSSFALETGDLLQGGHPAAALLYAVASLTLGVLAVFAGAALVR